MWGKFQKRPDGTTGCRPSSSLILTCRATLENDRTGRHATVRPGPGSGRTDCPVENTGFHSVPGCGATLFKVPGEGSKEGDLLFPPRTQRGREGWPSVIIKVGYSGGLSWLECSMVADQPQQTRFVILVTI